ncbi:MAG: cell division protein ZapA [Alphaproteobacteria bacterium]|nr:cell division protein ZapA [Alphaproteobacteria bacterium]
MNSPNEIVINLAIAERSFKVKVETQNEEFVRKMCHQVNTKIKEYTSEFPGKDMQDLLSMILIWFACEQSNQAHNYQKLSLDFLTEKLQSIDNMLTQQLETNQTLNL